MGGLLAIIAVLANLKLGPIELVPRHCPGLERLPQDFEVRTDEDSRAVRHDILHFSARVVATVVAQPSATPHAGGFKRRLWRERLSIRGSSRRFPVAPPVASESWLLTI